MATKAKKAIPDGYHTLTPHLVLRDGMKAIEFYKQAFGAEAKEVMPGPGGKLMHAELRIGDSIFMIADEFPEMGSQSPASIGGTASTLMIYSPNVDAAFERAVKAGAKATMPPTDMFWGDRYCKLTDPYGHDWAIATHIEDVTPAEMEERMKKQMSGPPPGAKK